MSVRSAGDDEKVIVTLGNVSHAMQLAQDGTLRKDSQVEHTLTREQAERLRDDLVRRLGPPLSVDEWTPSIGSVVDAVKHPGREGAIVRRQPGPLPWVVRRPDGTETGYAAHEIRLRAAPGMTELRAAFEALDRPDDAPSVPRLLLRAVREVLGCDPPRAVWGPGAPELRLEVEQLLGGRGSIAALGVSDRWNALIQAARLVVGQGRVWQLGDR